MLEGFSAGVEVEGGGWGGRRPRFQMLLLGGVGIRHCGGAWIWQRQKWELDESEQCVADLVI